MIEHPMFEVIRSPLHRVVGVAETVDASGVSVELLAIEVRAAGALLYWRAKPVEELVLLWADIAASDDRGTAYESLAAGHEGSALHWSGQSVLIPAPPVGVRLRVEVLSFGPPIDHEVPRGMSTQHVKGPWLFQVRM